MVDGIHSVGAIQVDVRRGKVDFLAAGLYKWMLGPAGVGYFYIREDLIPLISPDRVGWGNTLGFIAESGLFMLETLESQPLPENAERFEYAYLNWEGLHALDAELDYLNRIGMVSIEKRNLELVHMLREGLRQRDFRFYTPENNLAPILSPKYISSENG